jgi:CRP/FNR family cyclic AMP-dependent transcriptional regulator
MTVALEAERGLQRSLVFAGFSKEALSRIGAAGSLTGLTAGEVLAQRGDPGDAAWLVLEGELEVRATSAGGRHVRLAVLGAGEVAGEMAVLDGGPRSADMVATRRTRLLRIGRAALLHAFESEPRAAIALIGALTQRIRAADAELEAMRVLDLGGRLANLLLKEAGSAGVVPLTQTEIARRLGASREKVNRKLHAWAAESWVAVTRAGVKVARPDRLTDIVQQQEAR